MVYLLCFNFGQNVLNEYMTAELRFHVQFPLQS